MDKPKLAKLETNVEKVLDSYEKCEAGVCDGCAFEYMRRDLPAMCAFYQQHSARYLLKKLAEQMPRVMALEEVRRCGYHVFIELKDKNGAETIGSTDPEDLKEFKSLYSAFWHLHWRRGNVMLEEFYLGIPSNRDYKETDKYNATWRCWDKLPPDQLMEATPWE